MIRIIKGDKIKTPKWAYKSLAFMEYVIIIDNILLLQDLQFIDNNFVQLFIKLKKTKNYLNVIHNLYVSDINNDISRLEDYFLFHKSGIILGRENINESNFYTDLFERVEKVENQENITKFNVVLKHIKIKRLNDTKELLVHKK